MLQDETRKGADETAQTQLTHMKYHENVKAKTDGLKG